MITPYQPNQVVAQTPTASTYPPSVPVVVELQRSGDPTCYKYNMNVHPELIEEQFPSMFSLHALPSTGEGETSASVPRLTFQMQPLSSNSTSTVTASSMQQQLPATFSVQALPGPGQEGASTSLPVFTLQMSVDNQTTPVIVNPQALFQGAQLNYYSSNGGNSIKSLYITEPSTTTSAGGSAPTSSETTTPKTVTVFGSATSIAKELQNLFRWNYCKLCNIRMRSMRNAIDHYSSRAHDRRVGTWLMKSFKTKNIETNCNTKVENTAVVASNLTIMDFIKPTGGDTYYCELCDLQLTSLMHARQHFYGRRHRMVQNKISKPHGAGFYNFDGKWVRTNMKCFICPICDVNITSESQMQMHVNGSKHQKRLSTSFQNQYEIDGSYVYSFNKNGALEPLNPNGKYIRPLDQYQFNCQSLIDINAAFFCEVCCVTLNHIKSVKQHEEGKKHCDKIKRLGILVRF